MSKQEVDNSRRRFLTLATSAAGGVLAVAAAIPLALSWKPSERAKNAGAPVEIDLEKVEPGQLVTAAWQGKPVWVLNRTAQQLKDLPSNDGSLSDPESQMPQQPEYCKNPTRSIKPEWWVAVGTCTHLGCSPTYRPDLAPADLGKDWKGGFYCPCHGSKFDLAGRVFKAMPAPTNLVIPPHKYLTNAQGEEKVILVGVDS